MFGECEHLELEEMRNVCDIAACGAVIGEIRDTKAWDKLDAHTGGVQGMLLECLNGEGNFHTGIPGLDETIVKTRLAVQWCKYAGIVSPWIYNFVYKCITYGTNLRQVICKFRYGAKMGIGKDHKCKCVSCQAKSRAKKVYQQVVLMYMECGTKGSKYEKVHHFPRYRLATNMSFATPHKLGQAQTHRKCAWGAAPCLILI